jgi:hypothetical protein
VALSKVAEKLEFLRKHDNFALRTVIKYIYDDTVKFLIPNTPPPWKENAYEDEAKSLLYTEARRLRIFIAGSGYDALKPMKREQLFISLLEDIDNDDAKLLANHMITKKPIKGISKKLVKEAFPNLIEEKE